MQLSRLNHFQGKSIGEIQMTLFHIAFIMNYVYKKFYLCKLRRIL